MARSVNHPSYWTFTEPGFKGFFRVIDRHEGACHVVISSGDPLDVPMEVVWVVMPGHGQLIEDEGRFRVLMKEFNHRRCLVSIQEIGRQEEHAYMHWLLDRHPTEL